MMKLLHFLVLVFVIGEVVACLPKRKPAASKLTGMVKEKPVPEPKSKAKVSCGSKTKMEIVHGTHCWTLENILTLTQTDIREISSTTFEAVFHHDDFRITYE